MTVTHAPPAAVTVPWTATLTAPLHHGAGTSGNTSLLRTQEVVLPDGGSALVPFVSGNSVRHGLRAALAWHLVRLLAVADGTLTKAVVDLLWSGGALTKTGATADLSLAREVGRLLPQLALLGYSAGADMVAGTLHVSHLHLVCAENRWRLPADLADGPHAARPAAAYRGEEFGTRHDTAGGPTDRLVAERLDPPDTNQMIYDLQVVKPGAVLSGTVHVTCAATAAQRDALTVAVDEYAPAPTDGRRTVQLGAKNAVGFGEATAALDLTPVDTDGGARTRHEQHLVANRDEVLSLLDRLTS